MSKESLSDGELQAEHRKLLEKKEASERQGRQAEQASDHDTLDLKETTIGATSEAGKPEVRFEPWEVGYEAKDDAHTPDSSIPEENIPAWSAIREQKDTKKEEKKKTREVKEFDPEKEVENAITDLKIESILPEEFKSLDTAQKLLVLRGIKNRIVDIVKEDAQTQYSEDIKGKKFLKRIWAGVKKEVTLKNLEAVAFAKILENDEGKKLISEDLEVLSKSTGERKVVIKNGKPEIVFMEPEDGSSQKEQYTINQFNEAVNKLREIPYEYGQGRGKNRRKYDEATTEYNRTKYRAMELLAKRLGEEVAVAEILKLDSEVKMSQLLNTHPEVEKQFQSISDSANGREILKTGVNFLQTITGGKNLANKALLVGGYGFRATTASMGFAVGFTAPIIGATIGALRGGVRARSTLEERELGSRHGKKDTSKEALNTVSIEKLTQALEIKLKALGSAKDEKEKQKILDQINVRIRYTKDKIENGLVNFGESKSSLINQFNLLENLNLAINTTAQEEISERKNINERLNSFLSKQDTRIDKARKDFIKKEMVRGAIMGGTFATAGYLARWAGEHWLGWGDAEHAVAKTPTRVLPDAKIPESNPPTIAGVTVGLNNVKLDSNPHTTTEDLMNKFGLDSTGKPLPFDPEKLKVENPFSATNLQDHTPQGASLETNPIKISPLEVRGVTGSEVTSPASSFNAQNVKDLLDGKPGAGTNIANHLEGSSSASHEITSNFSIKLGENGVPKNLETAFNAIAANRMDVPVDGQIGEKFATKSLNMAANLVRLTEGKGVAGISAEDFGKAVSFKDGLLEVKDHTAFNQMLDKLQTHADGLWQSGTLQGKGAAIANISNISNNRWLEIMHAEGMNKGLDGTDTGIIGHDGITSEKIGNFAESELVKNAKYTPDEPVGSTLSDQETMESLRAKIEAHLSSKPLEVRGMTPDTEIKMPEELLPHTGVSGQAPENLPRGEVPGEVTPYNSPSPEEIARASAQNQQATYRPYQEPFRPIPVEMLSRQANQVYESNLGKMFSEDVMDQMQVVLKETSAQDLLETSADSAGSESMGNLSAYVHKLQELTGLEPKGKSLWVFGRNESTEDYIKRALVRMAQMGQLDKVKL